MAKPLALSNTTKIPADQKAAAIKLAVLRLTLKGIGK